MPPTRQRRPRPGIALVEFAFVVPTTFRGETLTRFAVVNPHTTKEDVNAILDTMS